MMERIRWVPKLKFQPTGFYRSGASKERLANGQGGRVNPRPSVSHMDGGPHEWQRSPGRNRDSYKGCKAGTDVTHEDLRRPNGRPPGHFNRFGRGRRDT